MQALQNHPKALKALIVDHDDSFTFNVKSWLAEIFAVEVIHHSKIATIDLKSIDLIVISPGPKSPQDYPASVQFLKNCPNTHPVLGICLGFQMMSICSGGKTRTYSPPLHGKTSTLQSMHTNFNQLRVARYHSLACELSDDFEILATSDSLPMWAQHKNKKWMGFQFHPESFMTEKPLQWLQVIHNWMIAT